MEERENSTSARRRVAAAFAAALAIGAGLAMSSGAPAQDLQSRIDQNRSQLEQKRQQLESTRRHAGVLSTKLDRLTNRVDQLSGEVATLENRLALVQAQLQRTQTRLEQAKDRLAVLRVRLQRSLGVLRKRLVAIYQSDAPDALTVILDSHGFDDMVNRFEYLKAIQNQDATIVDRVRGLRNRAESTVQTVRSARHQIALKQEELQRTRDELQARQQELAAAQDQKQAALSTTRQHASNLEGDVSGLQGQIAAQLQAQAEAAAAAAPEGPVQGGTATGPVSSGGLIWPVNGPITSPYCEVRPWEACHPGIDIGVPSGTPIHAAAAGTVAIAAYTGGYGNYTCIDHGGGLSTCYGHQQSFAVSVGQHVSQGQVIGYSDCTGLCFGPHLHFEVRINGQTTDPMGYL
jgi:peptidoglycan DL-endopeptidase CwlO